MAAAKELNVTGFPTILFLNENKEVVGKILGYLPPAAFADQMQLVLDSEKVPQWEEAVKANPKDVDALVGLGRVYAMREDWASAMRTAEMAHAADPKHEHAQLATLYNAVGDIFQTTNRPFIALEYFNRAMKAAKTPAQKAYAQYSAGYCYLALGKPRLALEEAEAGLKIEGLSPEDKAIFEGLKTSATRALGPPPNQ